MKKECKAAVHLVLLWASSVAICVYPQQLSAEPWAFRMDPRPYIEPEYGPRFYLGDEDTRVARAHFIHGDYGLAENSFRRAVEVTPQNSAAWVGLAACYDRLGRFDLALRAYRRAMQLAGPNPVILNNLGYSYLLRGRTQEARRLLGEAERLAPADPTIANNIAVLNAGQGYFWGASAYLWGWPP